MKLRLDENISRSLIRRIEDSFPESKHASSDGWLQAAGAALRGYAPNRLHFVSADSDFYDLAITIGPPPKVIWLKGCDYPTAIVEKLLRSEAIRIAEFAKDPEQAVLVLQPR